MTTQDRSLYKVVALKAYHVNHPKSPSEPIAPDSAYKRAENILLSGLCK